MARQKFLAPKDKHASKSWQKRNEARSVLQAQYAKAKAEFPSVESFAPLVPAPENS